MADEDLKSGDGEEKKPFYKTPLGIILIVVGGLLACCCLVVVIALATGGPIVEEVFQGIQGTLAADPDFQEAISTIEASGE